MGRLTLRDADGDGLTVGPLCDDFLFTIHLNDWQTSIYLKDKQIDELIEYLTRLRGEN